MSHDVLDGFQQSQNQSPQTHAQEDNYMPQYFLDGPSRLQLTQNQTPKTLSQILHASNTRKFNSMHSNYFSTIV